MVGHFYVLSGDSPYVWGHLPNDTSSNFWMDVHFYTLFPNFMLDIMVEMPPFPQALAAPEPSTAGTSAGAGPSAAGPSATREEKAAFGINSYFRLVERGLI